MVNKREWKSDGQTWAWRGAAFQPWAGGAPPLRSEALPVGKFCGADSRCMNTHFRCIQALRVRSSEGGGGAFKQSRLNGYKSPIGEACQAGQWRPGAAQQQEFYIYIYLLNISFFLLHSPLFHSLLSYYISTFFSFMKIIQALFPLFILNPYSLPYLSINTLIFRTLKHRELIIYNKLKL